MIAGVIVLMSCVRYTDRRESGVNMQIRSAIRIAGIITAVIAAASYVSFRAYSIDERYTEYLEDEVKEIRRGYNAYFTSRELAKDDISSFLTIITKKFNDIALVAVRGEDERPLLMIANNTVRGNTALYNEMSEDIYSNAFPASGSIVHAVRYYQNAKYYYFTIKCDRGSISVVFPRKLPFTLALRLILETLFIIVVIAFLFGVIYLKYSANQTPSQDVQSRPGKKKTAETKEISADEYIMSEIEKCATSITAESIVITFINYSNKLAVRSISWKNNKLLIINKPKGTSIESKKEIIAELSTGSSIIRDKGKKILLPIISRKHFAGIMTVSMNQKLSGNEISTAEKYAKSIARHM